LITDKLIITCQQNKNIIVIISINKTEIIQTFRIHSFWLRQFNCRACETLFIICKKNVLFPTEKLINNNNLK